MRGFALGDALGLPYEGLSPRRIGKLRSGRPLQHRILGNHGMTSDDTEHMMLTASAWLASQGDISRFQHELASRLRWWFLAIPPATGLATAKACCKLLIRTSPTRSGVRSAGNGPIMRTGLLGILIDDPEQLLQFVRAATLMTHTDERAVHGSMVMALATHAAARSLDTTQATENLRGSIQRFVPEGDLRQAVLKAIDSVSRAEHSSKFAASLGCTRGVSGFIMHTVPVAIHTWLSYPNDYSSAVDCVIRLGGDTDTIAASVGGLVAASDSGTSLPANLWSNVVDYPNSISNIDRMAQHLADYPNANAPSRAIQLSALPRNLLFLCVVLAHGLRRLLPPF